MIREATREDLPFIVDVAAKEMFEMWGNTELYNAPYLMHFLLPHLLENGIVLIDNDYRGVLVAMVVNNPFNPSLLVASELMWWVRQDCRNKMVGARLLKMYEQCAKRKGAKTVTMSVMPFSHVNLEKAGYVVKETAYTKEV